MPYVLELVREQYQVTTLNLSWYMLSQTKILLDIITIV